MIRPPPVALLAIATACGARSQLEAASTSAPSVPGPDAGTATSCASPPAAPPATHCTAWKAAGPTRLVSPAPPPDSALGVGAVLRTECGILTGWSTMSTTGTGPLATTLEWKTRTIGFDGAPLSDLRAHPALTADTAGSGSLSFAASGNGVGALITDSNGCKFVALDPTGADNGPVRELGSGGCLALAGVTGGFSFLVTTSQGDSPVSLTTIDPWGTVRATTVLDVPANRAVWDRLVFDDGSFLLYMFHEDAASTQYTSWVRHFDVRGAALAAEVDVGANSAPVILAQTKTNVLAAWEPLGGGGQRIEIVPLDRDGAPTGPHQPLPIKGSLYGLSLVPVPDGDVILVWLEETGSASSNWKLSVRALAPDGVARGPETVVLEGVEAEPVQGVVEETGARAVLVFGGGIEALPLECVQ